MTRIRGWLADSRITAWMSLAPLVYFAAEWVVSATWRGHYGYRDEQLGPLGIAFCGPAGDWSCSELYRAMNVGLVVTGLAIAFVAVSLLVQRVTDRGPALLLAVAGGGLAASGVVTYGVDYAWNLTLIVVFMTLGSVSVLFTALGSASRMSLERRAVAVTSGVVSLVGYVTYMGGHAFFGSGGAQRMAIYGILVGVIAVGGAGFVRTAGGQPREDDLVEETA
ncbi:hypothetical protein [Mycobacterium sp. NAZ190054]|uniref:hypothetical protein n=1 Tax=Mycobacterium sp. NAZ190054 TaxID=1747766 RepID=UPI00079155FF|nr:hypothetical protein [Mycobacterium sp. NAZ190054]KWX66912.1 hypothetical protein ASJ79_23665 [Mycobacterium sp. NAZ190054]